MNDDAILRRFAREIDGHEMTVLHDDGLYRHIRFANPKYGMYWFDLVTVPGALIFQGDGASFVFRRLEDMFAFFRGPVGRINPGYWAEKLTSGHDGVMNYDPDLLQQHVDDLVAEMVEDDAAGTEEGETPALCGLPAAVLDQITTELVGDESIDRATVDRFRYWANPDDEFKFPRVAPDFEFTHTWEWNCRDYDWWFLWALHAIVWGIAFYDTGSRPSVPVTEPAPPKGKPVSRAVVDVHLPEGEVA